MDFPHEEKRNSRGLRKYLKRNEKKRKKKSKTKYMIKPSEGKYDFYNKMHEKELWQEDELPF